MDKQRKLGTIDNAKLETLKYTSLSILFLCYAGEWVDQMPI